MRAVDTFYVLDPAGEPVWVLAGDQVPAHVETFVRAQVTNRGIVDGWDDQPEAAPEPTPAPAGDPVAPVPNPEPGTGDGEEIVEMEEPPRSGPGSGIEAWQEFGRAAGVDVEGLTRTEIIAAVDALPEG